LLIIPTTLVKSLFLYKINPIAQDKVFLLQRDRVNLISHNPATNSDSASGKSNGGLFVSANIAIKNAIPIGNNGNIFHTAC
jgi:hypothetical protein